MSDQHDEHEQRGSLRWVAFVIALVFLYVFSIGPVAYVLRCKLVSEDIADAVEVGYTPLFIAVDTVHAMPLLESYMDWCTDHFP